MRRRIWWISTIVFYVFFVITLLVFHPLQVLARVIGYQPHKKVVDAMLWCLNNCLIIVGSRPLLKNLNPSLPHDKPMIIISNHQSMMDIPAIGQLLRTYHPKYIAKKKLLKGLPSISYNIRHGGSITIDRSNPREAVTKIEAFTEYLNKYKRAGCIFPEGTRSWNGQMKPFKKSGLLAMLKYMPDAAVVPVAIDNFWKIGQYRMKPIPFGMKLSCTALPVISRDHSHEDIIQMAEEQIRAHLTQAYTNE